MKLIRKDYTPGEKRTDFWIGVAVFIGLNIFLYSTATIFYFSRQYELLFWLLNLGLLVIFLLTRRWIAFGMLGVVAFLIGLALTAALFVSVFCGPL